MAYDFSDGVVLLDELRVQHVLGAYASDAATVSDGLTVDAFSLRADVVTTSDLLGRMVWSARAVGDAIATEDAATEGELVLVLQGTDDAVSVGPIGLANVDDSGPLSISGGPDISIGPGPVGFVTRSGDFIAVTDRLAVELTDNAEATE